MLGSVRVVVDSAGKQFPVSVWVKKIGGDEGDVSYFRA